MRIAQFRFPRRLVRRTATVASLSLLFLLPLEIYSETDAFDPFEIPFGDEESFNLPFEDFEEFESVPLVHTPPDLADHPPTLMFTAFQSSESLHVIKPNYSESRNLAGWFLSPWAGESITCFVIQLLLEEAAQ